MVVDIPIKCCVRLLHLVPILLKIALPSSLGVHLCFGCFYVLGVFVSEYATVTSINNIKQGVFVMETSVLNSVQNLLSFIMLSKNTKTKL